MAAEAEQAAAIPVGSGDVFWQAPSALAVIAEALQKLSKMPRRGPHLARDALARCGENDTNPGDEVCDAKKLKQEEGCTRQTRKEEYVDVVRTSLESSTWSAVSLPKATVGDLKEAVEEAIKTIRPVELFFQTLFCRALDQINEEEVEDDEARAKFQQREEKNV